MGAGDKDLEYRIKVISDNKGAADSTKSLEKHTAAFKEAGKAAEDYAKKVSNAEAAAKKTRDEGIDARVSVQKALHASREQSQKEKAAILKADEAHKARVREQQQKQFELLKKQHEETQGKGMFGRMADAWRSKGGGLAGVGAAAGSVFGAGAIGGGVAATAATAAVIGVATKALREYGNATERQARLDAALAAQGNLRDDYRAHLRDMAGELQRITGLADDDWTEVIRKLTQFGAGPDKIEAAVEATKNLAGVMDGDLATAAQMVGKALEGEFTSFSRLGIVFDEHMTDTQKLVKLYEVLRTRGAGQLEAANEGVNGSFRTLRNGTSDLFEGLGAMLSRMLPLKQAAADLGGMFSSMGGSMAGIEGASSKLKNGLGTAGEAMDDAAGRARKYTEELDKLKNKARESGEALNEFQKLKDEEKDTAIAEAEAMRDRNLKVIDEREKRGMLTPMQAEHARQFQKENFEQFKLRTTNAADQAKAAQLRLEAQENQKPINEAFRAKAEEERKLAEMKAAADQQAAIRARHAGDIEAAKQKLMGTDPNDERDLGMAHELAKENLQAVVKKMEEELASSGFGRVVTAKMISDQEAAVKDKTKFAEEKRREFGPMVAQEMSEAARLERAVGSRNRIDQISRTGRAVDRTSAFSEAAAQQRGSVERMEGGGLRGSGDAISLEQQMEADRRQIDQARGGSGGQQRVAAILQHAQLRIQENDRIVELISTQGNWNTIIASRLARLEREKAILESQIRHAAGR